jgi:hypothetical protein
MVQANLTLAEILLAVVFMRSRSLYIGAQVYQINILERVSICQEGFSPLLFGLRREYGCLS